MSVPAAVPDAPALAVLVLAWDEATPAVRALLEATQARVPTVDSVLVLVPQADTAGHLGTEESQPVPALALEPTRTPTVTPKPERLPIAAAKPTLLAADNLVSQEKPISQNTANEALAPAIESAAPATPAPLAGATVRVLGLGSFSLSQLAQRAGRPLPAPTWTGTHAAPAAPYLGATVAPNSPAFNSAELRLANSDLAIDATPATELGLPAGPLGATEPVGAPVAQPATAAAPLPAKPRYEPTEAAQAPDLEADLQPSEADTLAPFTLTTSLLAENDTTQSTPPPVAQAGWTEALATLRQPARPPELAEPAPEGAPATGAPGPAAHPALRPVTSHYPAADLNFQIIQYARFAVPVALAEPPFTVLYAPAWPTWLAAQELRQRTGQPLVLHIATLAAADDESVDTATGWIAELQRQALRRADLILAETPALAQRLRHDLGLPASAVQAVPAADVAAIARALRGARPRPALGSLS